MPPSARGAGAAASGDGEFRAPLGAGPLRVRAPEAPEAARCLVLPRRANAEGPTSTGHPPGIHLVPAARGASAVLCPRAWSSSGGGVGRIHELRGEEEEVALEEGGEVPEVSRRPYLRGASGIDASNLSMLVEALAQRSAVK
jgi:hypothetical protein